jgi:hypothetical protein
MDAAAGQLATGGAGPGEGLDVFDAPPAPPEPCAPGELRALVFGGENDSDACERALAGLARTEGALDLAIGEGLLALCLGDRLVALGFSCLGDYAREMLGIGERKAQTMAQLARELRTRPLLRAAVRSGEVRTRSALAVLPVARGEAEAGWVERARSETVRSLEQAVRAARASAGEEDEWFRLQVGLYPDERALVDEALEIAGHLLPGSRRAQRLEAMAQEYLGEHPLEAGEDDGKPIRGAFRREGLRREWEEALEAKLEAETQRWPNLEEVASIAAPEAGFEGLWSASDIDARLRELAAKRDAWDAFLGCCAYVVRRVGLWRIAGFASFEHYCKERLGLAPRTVEQRAALEGRLWQVPALREARDRGLSYEKLRALARLPDREIAGWVPRARRLTCGTRSRLGRKRRCVRRGCCALGCPGGWRSCSRRPSGRSAGSRDASPTPPASSGWPGTSSRPGSRT